MISETQIDEVFPEGYFLAERFRTANCLDRDCNGGGIMLYVGQDITSNLITFKDKPIESL